jgi:hypothetical protein
MTDQPRNRFLIVCPIGHTRRIRVVARMTDWNDKAVSLWRRPSETYYRLIASAAVATLSAQ